MKKVRKDWSCLIAYNPSAWRLSTDIRILKITDKSIIIGKEEIKQNAVDLVLKNPKFYNKMAVMSGSIAHFIVYTIIGNIVNSLFWENKRKSDKESYEKLLKSSKVTVINFVDLISIEKKFKWSDLEDIIIINYLKKGTKHALFIAGADFVNTDIKVTNSLFRHLKTLVKK